MSRSSLIPFLWKFNKLRDLRPWSPQISVWGPLPLIYWAFVVFVINHTVLLYLCNITQCQDVIIKFAIRLIVKNLLMVFVWISQNYLQSKVLSFSGRACSMSRVKPNDQYVSCAEVAGPWGKSIDVETLNLSETICTMVENAMRSLALLFVYPGYTLVVERTSSTHS